MLKAPWAKVRLKAKTTVVSTYLVLAHLLLLLFQVSFNAEAMASADCESRFVSIPRAAESRFQFSHARVDNRAVYFEYLPAKRGKPTLFLLNGMFVPSLDLQAFREAFEQKSKGEGLLIMFYSTQLESLYLRGLLDQSPALNLKLKDGQALTRTDLANEAQAVLAASGARGPIYPVGYSFGSGPVIEFAAAAAKVPALRGQIKEIVLLSPFVHAHEHLPPGTSGMESLMRMNPFLGDSAIQKMRERSARTMAATSIDDYIQKLGSLPPGVDRETAIQGVTSQIMSLMDFDLRTVGAGPLKVEWPIRFVLTENEAPLRLVAQKEAFETMKKTSDGGVELTIVPKTSHHLLAYEPDAGTDALISILRPAAR